MTDKKIKSFDPTSCTAIRKAIEAALKAVGTEYGVNIKSGRGTYSGDCFSMKLEMGVISEGGRVATKEARDFRDCASWLVDGEGPQLKADDLYATFTTVNGTYEIVGAKPRSPKYPILGRCTRTRKNFKFGAETVARALDRARKQTA